jgi:hypothetical protein
VSAWRASLEGCRPRFVVDHHTHVSPIRKLAGEAADNGLIAPELAAGIALVKSVKSTGIQVVNWLSLRQAQALLSTPGSPSRASSDTDGRYIVNLRGKHDSDPNGTDAECAKRRPPRARRLL